MGHCGQGYGPFAETGPDANEWLTGLTCLAGGPQACWRSLGALFRFRIFPSHHAVDRLDECVSADQQAAFFYPFLSTCGRVEGFVGALAGVLSCGVLWPSRGLAVVAVVRRNRRSKKPDKQKEAVEAVPG